MGIKEDAAGNYYCEVELMNSEAVRITKVVNGWSECPCIRVQIRDTKGHLRQGPEIPVAVVGEAIQAIIALVSSEDHFMGATA